MGFIKTDGSSSEKGLDPPRGPMALQPTVSVCCRSAVIYQPSLADTTESGRLTAADGAHPWAERGGTRKPRIGRLADVEVIA